MGHPNARPQINVFECFSDTKSTFMWKIFQVDKLPRFQGVKCIIQLKLKLLENLFEYNRFASRLTMKPDCSTNIVIAKFYNVFTTETFFSISNSQRRNQCEKKL